MRREPAGVTPPAPMSIAARAADRGTATADAGVLNRPKRRLRLWPAQIRIVECGVRDACSQALILA
jgi:hypothetical protein